MLNALWNRLKRRGASPRLNVVWPFGGPLIGGPTALPALRKVVNTYSTFLKILPLETEDGKPHPFIKLLEDGPHPAYSRSDFFEALTWETLVKGQFICHLESDFRGAITRIDPFRGGQCRAYPVKGSYDDPISIARHGFYYRASFGLKGTSQVFWPDSALHIKDAVSGYDALNAPSRLADYKTTFDCASACLNAVKGLADSGGRGPVMISGPEFSDAEKAKEIRGQFAKVLAAGLSSSGSQVMTMPEAWKPHPLLDGQGGHSMMRWLSERSDLYFAQLYSLPHEFLVAGKTGAQSLKEVVRLWIRTELKGLCAKISEAFNRAVNDGTRFTFKASRLRSSDMREAAQYFSQLVQSQILSPAEARELLEESL